MDRKRMKAILAAINIAAVIWFAVICAATVLSTADMIRAMDSAIEDLDRLHESLGQLRESLDRLRETLAPPASARYPDKRAKAPPPEETPGDASLISDCFSPDVPSSFYMQMVTYACRETFGVDRSLALGLIDVESGFQRDAMGPDGCYGPCQLNPAVFPAGLSPERNLDAGIGYLAECLRRYDGDVEAALTAYNAGHDTGDRTYAAKVLEAAERWDVF